MPSIPVTISRQQITGQRYPIPGPEQFGAGIGRELERSGQIFERIQHGYDAAESAKLIGEGSAKLKDALIEAQTTISEPEQYKEFLAGKLEDVYQSTLEAASNPAVRRRVEAELANNRGYAESHARYGYFEKKRDRALGDVDVAFDQMSKAAAEAPDDLSRAAHYRNFGNLIGAMKSAAYLDADKAQKKMLQFDHAVLTRRATALINSSPESFFVAADAGQFERLGIDQEMKLRESARIAQERNERREERVARQVKEQVEQAWYTALGTGVLKDTDIDEAIRGQNPYITPQKALQFKKQKDEGIGGGGKDQVQAIMSDYYLSARNIPAISRTRSALRSLQSQIGSNEWINKAANELQSDQTTLENQGIAREANSISRENRAIADLQNSLEANKNQLPPALRGVLGNTDTQDKAKVKDIYKREGADAAKAFVESKSKETKQRVDSIPQQTKKVIELVK